MKIPGHPELDGKFFNGYCWIRNVGAPAEWGPADNDVAGSITRGYNMVKRGLDSMALATLLTHEWYMVNPGNYAQLITSNHWQQMLQGINSNLAPYHPIFVTLDYGCQYLRATRTSQLINADVDTVTGELTAGLVGYTDLPLSVNVYTGADARITNTPATVPTFSFFSKAALGYASVPTQLLGLNIQDTNVVFTLVGQYGSNYAIQASSDLQSWTPVQTVALTNGPATITVPLSADWQFYRAQLQQ
jgi:hypothetical protein